MREGGVSEVVLADINKREIRDEWNKGVFCMCAPPCVTHLDPSWVNKDAFTHSQVNRTGVAP